ncbi:LuxR family transcriptional regulator [Neorhizobium galegae]|uniref:LuxR family transcriptional regulator n=1 Tax=Neorhizobium galegae TaxID=399 RepID=UPI000621FCE3|nr:LuxR family transcriptional regulator [Neorhizobium galegae]MCQ1768934.1 LuxR family transcriptional regulator [Neorhizobium galegae]MCQ1848671.1 LuxR family transcriptional regulator [Neorhizobium galegae]CDZ39838.1 Autoinducer-binding transcriptional regulator BpsR [Neorhizobium galegae bv. officinalis]
MNIQLVVQLLVLVGEIKTEVELTARLESVLKAYGFEYYGLVIRPRSLQNPDGLVLAGRWPEGWQEIYEARKYALVDPTVRMLSIAQRPFRWRDAVLRLRNDPHRQRMQRMMQEGTRHGLQDGYVFPVHGRNGLLGNMTLGGRPVDLSPAEMALFDAAAKKAFWRFLDLRGQAEELEAVAKVDTQLTRREMEVIVLLADGLTSNEVAKSLDISSHTVDWYINGLQEKLRAKNRQHVVASAFRLGLIA